MSRTRLRQRSNVGVRSFVAGFWDEHSTTSAAEAATCVARLRRRLTRCPHNATRHQAERVSLPYRRRDSTALGLRSTSTGRRRQIIAPLSAAQNCGKLRRNCAAASSASHLVELSSSSISTSLPQQPRQWQHPLVVQFAISALYLLSS